MLHFSLAEGSAGWYYCLCDVSIGTEWFGKAEMACQPVAYVKIQLPTRNVGRLLQCYMIKLTWPAWHVGCWVSLAVHPASKLFD